VPTLSEADSRALVAKAGVPVSPYVTVSTADHQIDLDFPLVAKLCGETIAHKSERGLVRLNIKSKAELSDAITELLDAASPADGEVSVLVSSMIAGNRELIAGLATDPQFGPTVMLGLGGILAEAIADVSFRLAPVSPTDAAEMIDELSSQTLRGAFRGEPEVDRDVLVELLVGLGELGTSSANIVSIDLNPLIICDGKPIAVDALVELLNE
jgi:acetyl-CoA synthetase (ADP-forming)